MIRLGFRTSLFCLFTGLAGCSAAGNASGGDRASGDMPGESDADAGGILLDLPAHAPGDYMKAPSGDRPNDGSDDDDGTPTTCTCGIQVPGVDVIAGEVGVDVVIGMPGGAATIIATVDGNVTTSDGAVDISGDVSIDLGAGPIALDDATLHLAAGIDGTTPTLSGDATISGRGVLGGSCGCDDAALPVDVSLGVDANGGASLGLDLKLPGLMLDTSSLPAASGTLELGDVHVTIDADGSRNLLSISGDVTGKALPWNTMVPLQAEGSLWANVRLAADTLIAVELDADARLQKDALWCGLTPLASVSLSEAIVTLDEAGADVTATTGVSVHPGYELTGTARVEATFGQRDWSINVCGAVMTEILGANAQASTCLDLTRSGAKTCSDDAG